MSYYSTFVSSNSQHSYSKYKDNENQHRISNYDFERTIIIYYSKCYTATSNWKWRDIEKCYRFEKNEKHFEQKYDVCKCDHEKNIIEQNKFKKLIVLKNFDKFKSLNSFFLLIATTIFSSRRTFHSKKMLNISKMKKMNVENIWCNLTH